ncbi:MAG TPA: type II toxin-antitoxin system RelE/ParE family toxin [Chloroflexota bacterium]|nr:type II toxin-antitoxin system RelE/ParE family toxin [Chloroflexota bacterium]
MPVRVELTRQAAEDLARYAESGNLRAFLRKLVYLEAGGKDAGLPLGGSLSGWRKLVVGDRNWRIIYRMSADDTVATVWVIGDRADAECYAEAQRRIQQLGRGRPEVESLAAVMLHLGERRERRRPR